MKVPATAPPPGNWLTLIPTETAEGAAPLAGVPLSQLPPSAVLAARVQFNVPEPPLATCTVCEVAVVRLVLIEKLNWPGRSAKNAPEERTVSVTGTTIDLPGLANSEKMISPVYAPAASEPALMLTTSAKGVKQQPPPVGEIDNQAPPFAVATDVL